MKSANLKSRRVLCAVLAFFFAASCKNVSSDGGNPEISPVNPANGKAFSVAFSSDNEEFGIVSATVGKTKIESGDEIAEGTEVTFAANPVENCHFVKWGDGNLQNSRVIKIEEAVNLVATFEQNASTYKVSFAPNNTAFGAVSAKVGDTPISSGGEVEANKQVTFTATPKEHCVFLHWSDGDASATRTLEVNRTIDISAIFALKKYDVTFSTDNAADGTVSATANGEQIASGDTIDALTSISFVATPKAYCTFSKWSDGITSATRTETLTSALNLVATFERQKFTVAFSSGNAEFGAVSATVDGEEIESGSQIPAESQVVLTATPTLHCDFVKWSDGNTSATRTLAITGETNLTAEFTDHAKVFSNPIAFMTVPDDCKIYTDLARTKRIEASVGYPAGTRFYADEPCQIEYYEGIWAKWYGTDAAREVDAPFDSVNGLKNNFNFVSSLLSLGDGEVKIYYNNLYKGCCAYCLATKDKVWNSGYVVNLYWGWVISKNTMKWD